ncbi:hypothetical protein KBK24_0119210 [Burkholderia sp. K24]|nr:hypothetical protein KBK24_0119210 [Burkholderia sp. K24]
MLATSPTLASPTFTGSAAIAGGASNTNTLVVGNAANTSQGAQIQLIGNGATTPSKYLRAFGGTFAVLNNADNNILTLDDSGDATFNGNVTAPNFYGTVQGPTTGQFSIGSSLYPFVAQPVTTTANATNGSTSITVTSASGLAVGMGIYGSFVSSCSNNETIFSAAFVTAISGTTVTMSCPAVATASGASVQFGQPRWDSTSTLLANDIGAQTLKVGSAAQGNTASWLNQISAGQDYRLTSAAQIISPPGGGYGLTVAARTSDATGGAPAFPLQALFYADSGSPTNSEAAYFQSNLNSATAGKSLHIQFEQTIESAWGPPPGEDPYTINQTNQTIAHRLDCGSGGALTDNNCTSAIDIVPNAQAFESGIVFANGALDTGGGTRQGTVIGMPTMTGFTWYSGPSTYSAALWSPSAGVMRADVPTGGSYQFNINGSQVFGLKALLSSTTAPTISSGFGTGPTVYANNGTAAFGIHVGTSPGSSGILTMPTASNAWVCDGIDASQNNSTQFLLKQTASSTTSVTLGMFSSSGAAANFVAGDFLLVKCSAF